jgi:chaperonin GroES
LNKNKKENQMTRQCFEPAPDNILVKPVAEEEKTKGGIIVPGTVQNPISKGLVVDICSIRTPYPDGTARPTRLAVNDTVVFHSGAGVEITLDGEKFLVLHENAIIGRFPA